MASNRPHAVLSPSAAHRWMHCPPSARLEERLIERLGEETSPMAEEGTKAHALAELKLLNSKNHLGDSDGINDFNYKSQREALGDIPAEMDYNTDVYHDIVIEKLMTARATCPDAHLFVERKLDVSQWVPRCFGTGDAIIVGDQNLSVCDLKYGKGVPVSAIENPQARAYGLGAIAEFGEMFGFETVTNTIIQPRLDSVTEETLTRVELLDWGANELKPAAEKAWKGKGKYNPGEHCKFCKAKAICSTRVSKMLSLTEHGLAAPGVIADEAIPELLKILPEFEQWAEDIKKYALNQALLGQQWEGYKLVRGRGGARKWLDEEMAIDQLARAGYTREQCTETKVKSVTTIEKEIGKKAFEALMTDLVVKPEGALTLVPEDDKRVEYTSAEADFRDLETTV